MALEPDSAVVGADDEYVVEGALGGRLYRARASSSDREVALKLVPAAGLDLAAVVDRLENLSHPNVPSFYEAFAHDDSIALVHELVDGVSLAAMSDQGRPLSEREMSTWLGQMLDVLQFLHVQGLVHGHVAPKHVLLREDRETFLVDFELAPTGAPEADVLALAHTFRSALSTAEEPRLLALVAAMLDGTITTASAAAERFAPLRTKI